MRPADSALRLPTWPTVSDRLAGEWHDWQVVDSLLTYLVDELTRVSGGSGSGLQTADDFFDHRRAGGS